MNTGLLTVPAEVEQSAQHIIQMIKLDILYQPAQTEPLCCPDDGSGLF